MIIFFETIYNPRFLLLKIILQICRFLCAKDILKDIPSQQALDCTQMIIWDKQVYK